MLIEGEEILHYSIGFDTPSHIISSPADLNIAKTHNQIMRIETLNKKGLIERYDLRFRDINSIYDLQDLEKWLSEVTNGL